jgi:hypothetical protein
LFEASGGYDLYVQAPVQYFFLDILEESICLLVTDPFWITFEPEALAEKYLFFG